jgi:hypothetical protein
MIRYRHLVACAYSHSDAFVDTKPSQDQPGCKEQLALTGSLALGEPGVVGFKFRPEIFKDSILESGIPRERPSEPIFSSVRKRDPHRRLHIEIANAFAPRDRRREKKVP